MAAEAKNTSGLLPVPQGRHLWLSLLLQGLASGIIPVLLKCMCSIFSHNIHEYK